jgi:hypothetical protein
VGPTHAGPEETPRPSSPALVEPARHGLNAGRTAKGGLKAVHEAVEVGEVDLHAGAVRYLPADCPPVRDLIDRHVVDAHQLEVPDHVSGETILGRPQQSFERARSFVRILDAGLSQRLVDRGLKAAFAPRAQQPAESWLAAETSDGKRLEAGRGQEPPDR